jgi:hypothetical protein
LCPLTEDSGKLVKDTVLIGKLRVIIGSQAYFSKESLKEKAIVLVGKEHAPQGGNVQHKPTTSTELAIALRAYSRGITYHAKMILLCRSNPAVNAYKLWLKQAAKDARFWHGYVLKWGRI